MYTANTMASAIEAWVCVCRAARPRRRSAEPNARTAGAPARRSCDLLKQGIRPRDILTRAAFENAITVVIALGGSTNAVLHLLAMAQAAGVRLKLDDFTRIGRRVPVLADLRPSGRYLMSELIAIGGIQPLMKRLLEAGLLHGDCLTVTGHTLAENLRGVADYPPDQDDRSHRSPTRSRKTAIWLFSTATLLLRARWRRSPARRDCPSAGRCARFDGEEAATAAILGGKVRPGDVVVIRYEGPKGGPGMREMLSPTGASGRARTGR